ncbi:uncharacterized protein LOC129615145 [Condylostylus longicornis]|uniref:uncharacterized protein LOC129615145 n=1 Tax=Condylostylus longicornis TaxID=2530218 RepID=UPI00244DF274|nr:uncharacterized protein LOC129615145 [Condylostylus longicornis]XP_055386199.1 uncharacterized protein LOC129615145 [Condylostylus longicornis]
MILGLQVSVLISFIFSILTELSCAQQFYQSQQNQQKDAQVVLDINNRDRASGQVVAAIGDSATIICQNPGKFDYCRFVVPSPLEPNGIKTYVLSDKFHSTDPNIAYFGNGLDNGHCGIRIQSVQEQLNGNITCSAAVGPNEFSGLVNLFIARAPLEPVIEQEGPPSRNGYEVGQRITWKCIVRDGRPPAQIQWFIKDGEQYLPINSMNPRHRFETQEDFSSQLFTSIQELERTILVEDDGKFLVCRSIHEATRNIAEATTQLIVKYAPTGQREVDIYGLQLEKSNSITVQIKSNPRPRIEWKIDGDIIEERGTRDRFIAPELQQVGPNLYNATLTISPLMVEDLVKTYYLSAFNEIGRAEFSVRISSADTPAEGLEIGAIVGIVVVLAILLIVILLIVFARMTGKWCFAPKSTKSSTSETPDEFQYTKNNGNTTNKQINKKGNNGGGDPNVSLLPNQSNDANVIQIENNQDNYDNQSSDDGGKPPSTICCGLFNKNNNDNVQYTLTTNREFFDSENAVYNSTTVPIDKNDKGGEKRFSKNKKPNSSPQLRHTNMKNRTAQNRTASYAEAVGLKRASDYQGNRQQPLHNPKDDVELVTSSMLHNQNDDPSNVNINNDILLNELNSRLKNKNKIDDTNKYNQTQPPDVITTSSGRNNLQNNNDNQNIDSSITSPSRNSKIDLLTRGNELGIPGNTVIPGDSSVESRLSKWIPKDQRELLEKQARILSNFRTPPPVPEKPTNNKKTIENQSNNEVNDNIVEENSKSTIPPITTKTKIPVDSTKPFETEI